MVGLKEAQMIDFGDKLRETEQKNCSFFLLGCFIYVF